MQPIRYEHGRAMLLAGSRRRHDFGAAAHGVAEQWRDFRPAASAVGGACYGVLCGADATGFEYMCAVEVESFDALPEGTGRMRVPAQYYAVFARDLATTSPQDAWQAVFAWLSTSEFESAHKPDFEVYPAGVAPLGRHGSSEIWLGVVPRAR